MTIYNNKTESRRRVMRAGLLGGVAALEMTGLLSSNVVFAGGVEGHNMKGIDTLVGALRSTRNTSCLRLADKLQALPESLTSYDLHLRSASLSAADAVVIAQALAQASNTDNPMLRSFSMSYNTGLSDASVVALVSSFPPSVTEIGLVGCNIGDEAGQALVQWAGQASNLKMICVEQNHFSAELKSEFGLLARDRPALLVMV